MERYFRVLPPFKVAETAPGDMVTETVLVGRYETMTGVDGKPFEYLAEGFGANVDALVFTKNIEEVDEKTYKAWLAKQAKSMTAEEQEAMDRAKQGAPK